VLAVGDASFRRRALDSLRRLIADGKTVLFISHDMWNVRRLCDRIVWMDEGRVRASGPAAEIAEQYMEQVNLRALANQQNVLQSHRGGTGEVRYTDVEIVDRAGRPTAVVPDGGPLTIRAAYDASAPVAAPVFQVTIVDVDTGLAVASATSSRVDVPPVVEGRGALECVFELLLLRRRPYIVRMAITDAHRLVSYDVINAGPRFAVVRGGSAAAAAAEHGDEEGFVTLPFRFEHRARVLSS